LLPSYTTLFDLFESLSQKLNKAATHTFYKKCFALLCLCVWGLIGVQNAKVKAQGSTFFEHITAQMGLSQNSPNAILQDSRGLLWIGTQDGLNLYDGQRFKQYKRIIDNLNSLSDNYVLTIYEDKSGILWIGTEGGLNRFDFEKQRFTRYLSDLKEPYSLSNNYVRCIFEDSKGNFWVGTDAGLNLLDRKTGRFRVFSATTDAANHITSILEDGQGNLWVASRAGVARFDLSDSLFKDRSFERYRISKMIMDRKGSIWLGGADGLLKKERTADAYIDVVQNKTLSISTLLLDSKDLIWIGTPNSGVLTYNYLKPNSRLNNYKNNVCDPYSLAGDAILSIYEDQAGIIWIGTEGSGLNKFDRSRTKFGIYNVATNGLTDNLIRCVYEDRFGILWIGTQTGLNKLDRSLSYANSDNEHKGNIVYKIFEDRDRNVWVATSAGLFKYSNPTASLSLPKGKRYVHNPQDNTSLSGNPVRVFFQDSKGRIWLGTEYNGLNLYLPEIEGFKRYEHDPLDPKSISSNRVKGILEDRNGTFWISTHGGGLNRFNPETGEFIAYKTDPNEPYSISTNRVYPTYESEQGDLWVLTNGGGLNKMIDREKGSFIHYTESDGLPNNVLYEVLPDSKGNLWFSTNNGLSKFSPRDTLFTNFNIQDGLQSNEFNAGAAFKNSKGEMFFGGINGLNYFHPDKIEANDYRAPVIFTDFKLGNKSVQVGAEGSVLNRHISRADTIYLRHDQNSFSFEFAALHYSFPERNRYKYKLEGFDPTNYWTETNTGTAIYTNIDPGTYTFKVFGSNSDGVFTKEPIKVVIVIQKPWYRESWALGSASVLVFLLVYLIYKIRVYRVERKKKILEDKVQERTFELETEKANVEKQRNLLEEANRKITGSIRSAQRIQDAIIPSNAEFDLAFDEYFIYFKPRDIVSGDFYWCTHTDTSSILAVVDCTGHGVPGAFMSVVGFALLEQNVKVKKIIEPAQILTEMNQEIIEWLKQDQIIAHDHGPSLKSREGMDLALINLDLKNRKVIFAGAKNSIFMVNGRNTQEIKGDKFSIGGTMLHNEEKVFTNHFLAPEKGTMIYLTTDGFWDQFGGTENKKYSKSKFKQLLERIHELPAQEQREVLDKTYQNWKGLQKQIDDVLVIGIRI
jgi:ligand-binding sensor domain-containing protein/serine phosphatase RsbU (regulator of sigma subunit)